jgi:hypothetical protein
MKFIFIISLLSFALSCIAEINVVEADQCTQLKQFAEWREARTEKAMKHLISFAKAEDAPLSMKAVAALDLIQGYVPQGESYEWAGKNSLDEEDLVAFAMSSSSDDHMRWFKYSQTAASEKKTNHYDLKIYLNEAAYIHGRPLSDLTEKERLSLIQSRLNELIPEGKIDRVEYDTTAEDLMIAYGFYIDEKGNERILALLDTERYRTDERIEPDERGQ